MALIPSIEDDTMVIRSIGDHTFAEGIQQLEEAMTLARQTHAETNTRLHLLFDLQKSQENRSAEELRDAAAYFGDKLAFLTGRLAIYVTRDVHLGLSYLFSTHAEINGITAQPFHDRDAAWNWLHEDA